MTDDDHLGQGYTNKIRRMLSRRAVTKVIQDITLFADDIVSAGENSEEVNQRLDMRRLAMGEKGLRINRNKTEYIKYEIG